MYGAWISDTNCERVTKTEFDPCIKYRWNIDSHFSIGINTMLIREKYTESWGPCHEAVL